MEIALVTLVTYSFIGVAVGIVFGAIPGLNGGMIMALTLPLTYYMDPVSSQSLLIGMYVGSVSGGLISGILIGVPGSPTSVMTTLDGHAMSRQGKAGEALALGISASFVGGVLAWLVLALLSRPLAKAALSFGDFEIFALVMTGVLMISAVGAGSLLKALLAASLGILCALPGLDPIDATPRLTFGIPELQSGFSLVPVVLGIFAIAPVFHGIITGRGLVDAAPQPVSLGSTIRSFVKIRHYPGNLLRSSAIGTFIGALPGVGAAIGAIVAYSVARISSKTPESFGKGEPAGVVASESANNATVMGALIPMITLGIPGSAADVILLAALTLNNVQPGPMMIVNAPDTFYGIIQSALVANFAMVLLMVLASKYLVSVLRVPGHVLAPAIMVFCMVGTVTYSNNPFELLVLIGFSVLGLLMLASGLPLPAFVIGFVLTPIGEQSFRAAMMASEGSLLPFVTRPIPLTLLLLCLAALVWSTWSALKARRARDKVFG
jgi:putative tricarboxylic transport membrane protein